MLGRMIRRLWTEKLGLTELTSKEIGIRLSKKFPQMVQEHTYYERQDRCGKWVLINGPIYGDVRFVGTVIVESKKLADWAKEHAKAVFSSDTAEQKARETLPSWLECADETCEVVTLLDLKQREVLQGDCLRFLWSSWANVWCPECGQWHSQIKEHDADWIVTGKISLRVDDWHCPQGHLIYRYSPQNLRLIYR